MSHPPGTPAPTLTSLHDLVVDYITTQAYSSTAKTLARHHHHPLPSRASHPLHPSGAGAGPSGTSIVAGIPTAEPARDDDENGESMEIDDDDEFGGAAGSVKGKGKAVRIALDEQALESIEQRRAIINHIIDGSITVAVDGLKKHFPRVLAVTSDSNGDTSFSVSGRHTNGHSAAPSLSSSHAQTRGNGHSDPRQHHSHTHNNHTSSPSYLSFEHSLPVFHHSTHPSHISLNLQIQQFIESLRLLAPPSAPSSPSSSIGSLTNSQTLNMASSATLQHALSAAQDLHKEAKKFPPDDRAVYLQEIKDVGALFAYTDPETSVLKGFLDQGRRIALAEQVNAAILESEGKSIQSQLETFARRTTAIYNLLAENGIDPRPPWTAADGQGKEQLAAFWKNHSGRPFSLAEFVAQTW